MQYSALYMTVLNICDVPYSVNVVSMLDTKEVSVHKYTAERSNDVLHITREYSSTGIYIKQPISFWYIL